MHINTKILMTSSALVMLAVGIVLTFLPVEVLSYFGVTATSFLQVQILGALYFAFGMLNWMIRDGVIGGIYNRPIVVANVAHFLIGGLAQIKGLMSGHDQPLAVVVAAAVYSVFALLFGFVLFAASAKLKPGT